MKKSHLVAICMGLASFTSAVSARADMIEVGVGAQTGSSTQGSEVGRILLEVRGYQGSKSSGPRFFEVVGRVGVGAVRPDGEALSFIDFETTPVQNISPWFEGRDGRAMFVQRFLPLHITRELAIGQDLSIRVSALGAAGHLELGTGRMRALVEVAIDALGAHYLSLGDARSNVGTFKGFSIADLNAKIGFLASPSETLRIRVVAGAQSALSYGRLEMASGDVASTFVNLSSLYGEVALTLGSTERGLEIYSRGSLVSMGDFSSGAKAFSDDTNAHLPSDLARVLELGVRGRF